MIMFHVFLPCRSNFSPSHCGAHYINVFNVVVAILWTALLPLLELRLFIRDLSFLMVMNMIKVHGLPFSACAATVLAFLNEYEAEYQLIPVNILAGDNTQPTFLTFNVYSLTTRP